MRISERDIDGSEIDYFVNRVVTVMIHAGQRPMADPEEFHGMFTGVVVQMNHLGLWLLTSQGRKSFIFWQAVQGIFDERAVSAESEEAKEAMAKAEKARQAKSQPAKPPINMPTIPAWAGKQQGTQHHGGHPACGMPPGTPPELVQLTFDKLKERATNLKRQGDEDRPAE